MFTLLGYIFGGGSGKLTCGNLPHSEALKNLYELSRFIWYFHLVPAEASGFPKCQKVTFLMVKVSYSQIQENP